MVDYLNQTTASIKASILIIVLLILVFGKS